MENNDQNLTPQPPVVNPVPSQPVQPLTSSEPTTKMAPMESIKYRFGQIGDKIGLGDPSKKKKILIGGVALLVILILISVGYALIPKQVANPLATFTPAPTISESTGTPSEYANDPEVLRIMDALSAFDKKADETVIREDDLRQPSVDWNVSFK